MPRKRKHEHDPFPATVGECVTAFAYLVIFMEFIWIVGEIGRFLHAF